MARGDSWKVVRKAEGKLQIGDLLGLRLLPGLGGTWAGIAWGLGQGGRWLACNLMYACVLSLSKF